MSRLFIELFLDEDVDVTLAQIIRSRGLQATTVQEVGRKGLDDDEQLEYAVAHQLTMLTHNRADYEELDRQYRKEERQHYGIVIAVRRPLPELARRVMVLLNRMTADEMENLLLYL